MACSVTGLGAGKSTEFCSRPSLSRDNIPPCPSHGLVCPDGKATAAQAYCHLLCRRRRLSPTTSAASMAASICLTRSSAMLVSGRCLRATETARYSIETKGWGQFGTPITPIQGANSHAGFQTRIILDRLNIRASHRQKMLDMRSSIQTYTPET